MYDKSADKDMIILRFEQIREGSQWLEASAAQADDYHL